jgi:carboxylesterase
VSAAAVRPGAQAFSLGEGPVGVVLVHGFTGSPASTRPLGEWLASNDLAVEGVRLPGHGIGLEALRRSRWIEWTDEVAEAVASLRGRCRTVVAFGQSMGASVVLHVAASRPHDVDGIAVANPYVFDARHLAIPVVGRLLRRRDLKGVGNDIAKPGQDENADARMPVPAIVEMAAMMRLVRSELPEIRQPLLVFRSDVDHVVPRSTVRKLLRRIGSARAEVVACPRSFHVVTLDYDAPLVSERLLAFASAIDAERRGRS